MSTQDQDKHMHMHMHMHALSPESLQRASCARSDALPAAQDRLRPPQRQAHVSQGAHDVRPGRQHASARSGWQPGGALPQEPATSQAASGPGLDPAHRRSSVRGCSPGQRRRRGGPGGRAWASWQRSSPGTGPAPAQASSGRGQAAGRHGWYACAAHARMTTRPARRRLCSSMRRACGSMPRPKASTGAGAGAQASASRGWQLWAHSRP